MFSLPDKILSVTASTFEEISLEVFRFQYDNVEVYRMFCNSLRKNPSNVTSLFNIPFIPVDFFKSHSLIAAGREAQQIFESSRTTNAIPSKHYVADTGLYEKSFQNGFRYFYGDPGDYAILALLPSYLERKNSSLVYMADRLIKLSDETESGFFLNDFKKLADTLFLLKERKQKTLLLGVTFALLDFADQFKIEFPELTVMETGGMKGRREELTRLEIHHQLSEAFNVEKIHSEYGMTELLSQAYSKGDGIFQTPNWMKIITRDIYDPLRLQEENIIGAANVIDLANLYSCSFIATSDLGKISKDGSFEILGRMDNAEIRGCNLMVV
ncbi:MAG: acyl transferase [Bacteroidota bacterium]